VGAVALDSQRSEVHQTMAGLRWARQVATQAEGMVFKAREDGHRDAIGWVVGYLSQGVEPRLVHVTRAQANDSDSDSQSSETYSRDRGAGLFEYTRILTPENGAGIHVQIVQGYTGFLGAQSALASDFLTLVLFSLVFAVLFLRTGRYFGFDDARRLRLLVTAWVSGARAQVTRHGSHVRDMVREAQRLAVCTGRARHHVHELRENIHAGLNELHESRDFYKEGENIASRAETLALNMAIEANRLGGEARRIADMATELHRRLQALHAVNRKGQALVQRIERRIEPWATDADLAFHAFDDVKDATQLLGTHIRSTTESLLSQAKMIQGLNQELGAHEIEAKPSPSKAKRIQGDKVAATSAPGLHSGTPRLPDPLPPIDEKGTKPRLARKIRVLQRKIRHRKSA
jgi:hypothetical protein